MFSISFTPTASEYVTVRRHLLVSTGRRHIDKAALNGLFWTAYAFGILGVLSTIAQVVRLQRVGSGTLPMSAIGACIGFLLLLVWSYARQALVKRLATRERLNELDGQTIRASETDLSVARPDCAVTYQWAAVVRIETVDDIALFYTAVDSAVFVPARAFESRETFSAFVDAAQKWQAPRHSSRGAA